MGQAFRIFRPRAAISRRRFLYSAAAAGAIGLTGLACDEPLHELDQPDYPQSDDQAAGWSVQMQGPSAIDAGGAGVWTFLISVGDSGLYSSGRVALAIEHGADWIGADEQRRPAERWGGVLIQGPDHAVFGYIIDSLSRAGNALEIELLYGELKPGEQFSVSVGDDVAGGAWRAPTIAHQAAIRAFCSACGSNDEHGLTAFSAIEPASSVEIRPLAAQRVSAFARSAVAPGAALALLLRLEDGYGNLVPGVAAVFDLFVEPSSGIEQYLGSIELWADAGGAAVFEPTMPAEPGVYRLRVEWRAAGLSTCSNPFEISADPAHERVLWGQIHGHSLASDGLGTPAQWYEFCRDKSLLDFAALTDHGYLTECFQHPLFLRHQLNPTEWDEYRGVCREFNEPGRFATFLAYEWTSHLYSDKNVYFLSDDEPHSGYPTNPIDLAAKYRGRDATIVSHMMWAVPLKRATDWSLADTSLERVVEVASVHGVREYAGNPYFTNDDTWTVKMQRLMRGHLVADGLTAGLRLGLICGGDDHTGLPGSDHRGRHACRIDGLMALRATAPDRAAIWQRWQARQCYGTTGPRMLLDFSVNGCPMGSETVSGRNDPRRIEVTVYAPRPITRIEIVRNDPTTPWLTHEFETPVWNPGLSIFDDTEALDAPTFYYARVFQDDGHMAWASPVWVDPV